DSHRVLGQLSRKIGGSSMTDSSSDFGDIIANIHFQKLVNRVTVQLVFETNHRAGIQITQGLRQWMTLLYGKHSGIHSNPVQHLNDAFALACNITCQLLQSWMVHNAIQCGEPLLYQYL